MQTIEPPIESIQERTELSTGWDLDIALVGALVCPPALIVLLTLFGFGFALAVCVVFAVVFVITTVYDAWWMWQRRREREDQWNRD